MQKQFTVNVPDQLWVDEWNTDKTESYVYSGPDILYVRISGKTNDVVYWSLEPIETQPLLEDFVVEIAATSSEQVAVAHHLHSQGAEHTHSYEDEINHDGSTYKKITNPTIQDWFEIKYDITVGVCLNPIYKNTKSIAVEKAEKRLDYVKKYDNVYDFDTETQAIIDKFLLDMTTYLATMTTAYPWKYVTIDENQIPKIHSSLVSVFRTLPELE